MLSYAHHEAHKSFMEIRGWVDKRNSDYFHKHLQSKQDPAARHCTTTTSSAAANPPSQAPKHEGDKGPALGRTVSCHIAQFADSSGICKGKIWATSTAHLLQDQQTKQEQSLSMWCVCSYMCFVFTSKLFWDKQETDYADLQVIKKDN